MRIHVAGAEMLQDQILMRAFDAERAKVHHDGYIRRFAGLDGVIDGDPFRPGEVRGFDADDELGVLLDHGGDRSRIHVFHVLLHRAAHAGADDVQERKDARLRPVDDTLFEDFEVAPAGRAGVDNGGDAATKSMGIRDDAELAIAIAGAIAIKSMDV